MGFSFVRTLGALIESRCPTIGREQSARQDGPAYRAQQGGKITPGKAFLGPFLHRGRVPPIAAALFPHRKVELMAASCHSWRSI